MVPCAAWVLVRVLGLELGYPLSPAISYTPYVLPVVVVATIVAVALRQWPPAAVAGTAALVLVVLLAPRVIGGPDDETEGRTLNVMASNLLRGSGDPATVLRLVRDNDVEILTLQELTPEFKRRFERLGGRELLPHAILALRPSGNGNGVYSRYPLRRVPSDEPETEQLRTAVAIGPDVQVEAVSVHTRAPIDTGSLGEWERSVEALPKADPDGPMRLLLGDFNASFDHPQFRDVVGSGYQDAAEQMGDGLIATWPTRDKPFRYLPVTLDHLLYDERLGARKFEAFDLPGTDHRAVYAQLVVPKSQEQR